MHRSHLFAINLGALTIGSTLESVCYFLKFVSKFVHLALVQVPDIVNILGIGVDPMRLAFGVISSPQKCIFMSTHNQSFLCLV